MFEGRGFYYCKDLLHAVYPDHTFCSTECLDGGSLLASVNGNMPRLTDMELQAIKETRGKLWEALVLLKREKLFDDWTPAEIDAVILACAEGVRRSLQKQSKLDPDRPPF